MKTAKRFRGICPAIVSPFDRRERFDSQGFARIATHLYQEGVHGLYVCGLTGDGYGMTPADRRAAAATAVKISRGKGYVIVHVGTQDTATACALAEHAAAAGADAVASIPPINRSHAEVLGYYRKLARAADGLPLLVYHIPPYTHHTPTADQFAELLDIPGVIGLKFTDYNLFLLTEILARRPDATILYGRDEQLLGGLMFGALGGVGTSYNIAPRLFVQLWDHFTKGELVRAMEIQARLTGIMHELVKYGVMTGTEAFLKHQHGIHGCFRRPAQPLAMSVGRKLARQIAAMLK